MEPTKTCPLCKMVNIELWNDGSRNTKGMCPRCGEFSISWELGSAFGIPEELLPYVSAATRRASAFGKPLFLKTTNWREFAEAEQVISVSTKIQRLFEFVAEKSRVPGRSFSINLNQDYPLFSATSPGELSEYLSFLPSKNLIRGPAQSGTTGNYTPTIEGWQKLEPLASPGGEPDRCFVAMWFHDDLDSVYDAGFTKAIEQCGFRPYRVKEDPTNKSVIDKILAEIPAVTLRCCGFYRPATKRVLTKPGSPTASGARSSAAVEKVRQGDSLSTPGIWAISFGKMRPIFTPNW